MQGIGHGRAETTLAVAKAGSRYYPRVLNKVGDSAPGDQGPGPLGVRELCDTPSWPDPPETCLRQRAAGRETLSILAQMP